MNIQPKSKKKKIIIKKKEVMKSFCCHYVRQRRCTYLYRNPYSVLINIANPSRKPILSVPTTPYGSVASGPDDSYNRGIVGSCNEVGRWKKFRIDQRSLRSMECPAVNFHREWIDNRDSVSTVKLNGLGIANGCSYRGFGSFFHGSSTTSSNDIVSSEIQNSEGNVKDSQTPITNSSNNSHHSHSKSVQIENSLETHTKRLYFYLENNWNDSDKNDEWWFALSNTMKFMMIVPRLNIKEQNALWNVFLKVYVPESKLRMKRNGENNTKIVRAILKKLLQERHELYHNFLRWGYGSEFFKVHKEMVWLDHSKLWKTFIELGDIPNKTSFNNFLLTAAIHNAAVTPPIHNLCDILTYMSQSKFPDQYPTKQTISTAISIVVSPRYAHGKSKQECEVDVQHILDCMVQANIELDASIFKSMLRFFLKYRSFHKIRELVSEDEIFCLSDFECCRYMLQACNLSCDTFDYEYTHKCIQNTMKNYIEYLENHQKNDKNKYRPNSVSLFMESALEYYGRMKKSEHFNVLWRQIEYSMKLIKNIQIENKTFK